jgi:uncharacterized protein YjgD (DUF1641 family)
MGASSLELEEVAIAARDALTDEMVARLAQTASDGLDLIDRANRAGIAGALPALKALVENGDLERLTALARVFGAAEDALTDEMVARLGQTAGGVLALVDRLDRAGGCELLARLEHLAESGAFGRLEDLVRRFNQALALIERVDAALAAADRAPPAPNTGGLQGLWQLLRDPETQAGMRYMMEFGRGLRQR